MNNTNVFVYVVSKNGKKLMPTRRCGHVRILVKNKKAKVIREKPYTIKLLYDCPEITQELYGDTDQERTNTGEAVLNGKSKDVYAAQEQSRNKEVPETVDNKAIHQDASAKRTPSTSATNSIAN